MSSSGRHSRPVPNQHWNGEVYWSKYQRAFIRVEKYDKFGPGTYVPRLVHAGP